MLPNTWVDMPLYLTSPSTATTQYTLVYAGVTKASWLMRMDNFCLIIYLLHFEGGFPWRMFPLLLWMKRAEVHIRENKLLEEVIRTEEKKSLILPVQVTVLRKKMASAGEG